MLTITMTSQHVYKIRQRRWKFIFNLRIIRLTLLHNTTFSDKIRPIFCTGQSIGSTLIHTNYKLPDFSLGSICNVCNSKICECSISNVIYQLICKLCSHNNRIYL